MKIDLTQTAIVATTLLASSAVTADDHPAAAAVPVMGPWTLSIMAVLVASVAYWIKKK